MKYMTTLVSNLTTKLRNRYFNQSLGPTSPDDESTRLASAVFGALSNLDAEAMEEAIEYVNNEYSVESVEMVAIAAWCMSHSDVDVDDFEAAARVIHHQDKPVVSYPFVLAYATLVDKESSKRQAFAALAMMSLSELSAHDMAIAFMIAYGCHWS